MEHQHKDVYSEFKPIPRIERFFKRGLAEVIERRGKDESQSEDDDEEMDSEIDDRQDGKDEEGQRNGEKTGRESSRKGKERASEDDQDGANQDGLARPSTSTSHSNPEGKESRRDEKKKKRKNERIVVDPTTNMSIKIKDVGRREYAEAIAEVEEQTDQIQQSKSKTSLDSPSSSRSPFSSIKGRFSSSPTHEHKSEAKLKAKGRKEERSKVKENVLNLPFPPETPLPETISQVHRLILPIWISWSLVLLYLSRNSLPLGFFLIASNSWLGWWSFKQFKEGVEDRRWEKESRRGREAIGRILAKGKQSDLDNLDQDGEQEDEEEGFKEGAEWLNTLLSSVWSVMDPSLFSNLGSTLEDVMQASIPSFINAVKVVDLAQGSTPIRITGLRILPDREVEDLRFPNKSSSEKKKGEEESGEKEGHQDSNKNKRPDEEKGASYINMELSLVYRAKPVSGNVESKSRNAHLLIQFFLGLKKLVSFPLPVWVEIKGFVGTMRLRIQLTPDPPFIKNLTFTFCGLPRARVEVVPLYVNLADLPLISNFVQSSINAAIGEYVAPNSMKLDVGEILMGDNIKREVDALGLIVIWIHSASDLEKQDRRGSSDPYCTIAYNRQNKVLYATRVALDDLNPRWEERHVLLLHSAALRAKEKVTISLWDSDRFTADDILGRVEIDLVDLVNSPKKLHRRNVALMGISNGLSKKGNLQYSCGFYPKTDNRQDAKCQVEDAAGKSEPDRSSKSSEKVKVEETEFKNTSEIEPTEEDAQENHEDARQTRNKDHSVSFQMPDSRVPSGILSIQIHQITGLEVVDNKTHVRPNSGYEPGQDFDDGTNEEDESKAPSSYCQIILNDQTVFVSRVKALTHAPFFQAGTERFIRDWSRTLVMVVVRDRRLREADPILGVVPIKLIDLFKEEGASQVTRFFPIGGGVGRGEIKLSILFRGVNGLGKENSKLGWDVATCQIHSAIRASKLADDDLRRELQRCNIKFKTLGHTTKLSHVHAHKIREDEEIEREVQSSDQDQETNSSVNSISEDAKGEKLGVRWNVPNKTPAMKIPLRRRYATPLVLEFQSPAALGRKTLFMSIVWLSDIEDDKIIDLKLPIWRAKHDFHRLRQNYSDYRNEDEAQQFGVYKVGELDFKIRLKSGVGYIHVKFDKKHPDHAQVLEAWRCCVALGLRTNHGDFTKSASDDFDDSKSDEDQDQDQEGEGSDSEEEEALKNGEENDVAESEVHQVGEEDVEESEDGGDENDEEGGKGTLRSKLRKWSEERKELHRQQKGIKQFKPVRTASWLTHAAGDKIGSVSRSFSIQERRSRHVESEV